jgi:hypothetical protein
MVSIKKLPEKERRKERRFNHIAKDLRSDKYRQQIVPDKHKKHKEEWNEYQDYECIQKFLEFLDERITINTAFVRDPETGNLTHQIIEISCGEMVSLSQPQPLDTILRPATGAEIGATVN